MSIDYEIFEGKSLSSLFEDIYKNTEYNRKQLDILTKELVQFIKDGDTAVQIVIWHRGHDKRYTDRVG